ncbi:MULTISPECIES: DUF5365 family protein [Heyndrickxia]|uniref:DUF5365 family protein n=1 Tax=Heyndrickxia TaxID=2837504 RepID=UPI0007174E8B|nr:DUF5365 family protein [Heyndrickxia oleronia]NYV66664.1 DUF5365 family protein [Bacillus sp. Gen3]OJH17151.1 hypothetical protein BLX88_19985 [Bacillus obstructivus]MBU5211963.1 YhcU family protein [Heyndrickxia oleronia]MCI1591161.1 YhcU family protein [Heyndrickxia oleronia]MCI1615010.1 YhcU family protein [Heyndrickxia oleronia]
MKVLYASTEEQEKKIVELINQLYTQIFPFYYEDEEIAEFKKMGVLHIEQLHFENFNTLKDAFQVIASLQTIITILEEKMQKPLHHYYGKLFNRNIDLLEKYDIFFPFNYSIFNRKDKILFDSFSIYKKAANEILI